jgi:dinuclear metal center YbgI/SA1388 family protein
MTVYDIQKFFADWAPDDLAWEKDNVGLQVGNGRARVSGILVSLDVTRQVIAEAKKRRANLLVSHHPLLFRAQKSLTPMSEVGVCVERLILSRINLFSAHTNLDFVRGGTSFALAEALGLRGVDFLHKPYKVQKKLVTYVPTGHEDRVADAMAEAGAGRIGNYDRCSFRSPGIGAFRGNQYATPVVGKTGVLEKVSEVRIEMIVDQWKLPDVMRSLKASHPYEEVAYEVYPVENTSDNHGMGVIGMLPRVTTLSGFLKMLKTRLGAQRVRCTGVMDSKVQRIAACGGSGAELLDEAIRQQADVFVTADVKYHAFHHAKDKIALVDAGHFETEHLVVNEVVKRLREFVRDRGAKTPVFAAATLTNPVFYI